MRKQRVSWYLFFVILLGCSFQSSVKEDFLIANVQVADGTGGPLYRADLLVRGGRIDRMTFAPAGKSVRPPQSTPGLRVIDGSKLVAAPGFIDLHSHADWGFGHSELNRSLNNLKQGITTVVVGQDGRNAWPAGESLSTRKRLWETQGIATNAVMLVGHGSVRAQVIGEADRKATVDEIEAMKQLVREAMEEGAYGISTGLGYIPGTFSDTAELIAVTSAVAPYHGFYISHLRDQGDGLLESISETVAIGAQTGVPVVVSHIKASRRQNFGKSRRACDLIERARARGVRVYADLYPYETSSNGIDISPVPPGLNVNKLLSSRGSWQQLIERYLNWWGGPDTFVIDRSPIPGVEGKNLEDAARALGKTVVDLAIELYTSGSHLTNFHMDERDVETFIQKDYIAACTDGTLPRFGRGVPHPRSYGSFARRIRRYVFDKELISLPHAIRTASGLAAEIIGLKDRGLIKSGYRADLILFDPERIRDKATYAKPHQYSEGIEYLWVNGVLVLDQGEYTDALPGQVLLRKDAID